MKKLIAIMCLLFLLGCVVPEQPSAEEPTKEETVVPTEPEDEKVIEKTVAKAPPAPSPTTTPEEPEQELGPELQALLSKADEKVKNVPGKPGGYQFLYAPPPDNLARDKWFIKGNKIMIKLYEQNVIQQNLNYDTIYIDTETKKAEAYCEDERSPRCPDAKSQFIVDYDEVMVETPYQWMKSIQFGEIVGSEMLWDRKTEVVLYIVDDTEYKQWIDGFSGLTVKVMIDESGKDPIYYEFRDLAINSVSDEMLKH